MQNLPFRMHVPLRVEAVWANRAKLIPLSLLNANGGKRATTLVEPGDRKQ